jgi:MFS family permease
MADYRLVAKSWQTPFVVLIGGCLISLIGFGARSSYGLYLGPMTLDLNWTRETFALAMALQNLFWGLCLPLAGVLADRYGPLWVIVGGALIYALGTFGMTWVESSGSLYLAGGILVGTGVAFTSFSLVTAIMVRVVGVQRRSLVMGLCTAAGSVGQVLYSPITQGMISNHGWSWALVVTAVSVCLIIPLAFMLPNDPRVRDENVVHTGSIGAMREAFAHRGFLLLTAGFFVCGFHVAFISVHLPVYVSDLGLGPMVGAIAISLIGIFNIVGSLLSGAFGQRFSKKWGLSGIYAIRAVTLLVFLVAPKSALTIYIFSATMGLLWLSTVPLTAGIIAQVFGIRYMATLYGFVFLGHQIGSFIGVWMGGYIHDLTGSYDLMWQAGIILGLGAALIHLPINEQPVPRLQAE